MFYRRRVRWDYAPSKVATKNHPKFTSLNSNIICTQHAKKHLRGWKAKNQKRHHQSFFPCPQRSPMEETLFANGGRHCGFRSTGTENFQSPIFSPSTVISNQTSHFSPPSTSVAHFPDILNKFYLLFDEENTLEKTETLSLKFS